MRARLPDTYPETRTDLHREVVAASDPRAATLGFLREARRRRLGR